MEHETAEGDMLFVLACEAMAEFATVQRRQARFQDELKSVRESMDVIFKEFCICWASMDVAFREFSNCRALHEAARAHLEGASQGTIDLKRKAGRP